MNETLIFWPIHTLDRTKAKPFPLEIRTWCLKWEEIPESVGKAILNILAPEIMEARDQKIEPNEGDEEATLGFSKIDGRILKFRKYFVYEPDFDLNKHADRLGKDLRRPLPVNLHFEYFEDEAGRPISKIEIYRFKTGEANPVVPFEPLSVVCLGPSPMHASRSPSQDDSETLAHLLEIIQFLAKSSWYRSPPALTFRSEANKTEIESLFPNVHETTEVALAIRQLYASDELFNRGLNCYVKLCGDDKKITWIKQVQREFNRFLNGANSFPMIGSASVRELLDVFLYGGGIAHSPDKDKKKRLQELVANFRRANVIMAVQTSFRRLVDFGRLVYPVLVQDYHAWLAAGKCPNPARMSIGELLSSNKEEVPRLGRKPSN